MFQPMSENNQFSALNIKCKYNIEKNHMVLVHQGGRKNMSGFVCFTKKLAMKKLSSE